MSQQNEWDKKLLAISLALRLAAGELAFATTQLEEAIRLLKERILEGK